MHWRAPKSQTASFLNIATPGGRLTLLLATAEQVTDQALYNVFTQNTDKRVLHIACADEPYDQYPVQCRVHRCCMYDTGQSREDAVAGF